MSSDLSAARIENQLRLQSLTVQFSVSDTELNSQPVLLVSSTKLKIVDDLEKSTQLCFRRVLGTTVFPLVFELSDFRVVDDESDVVLDLRLATSFYIV
jgi:hypothetical protein